MKRETTALAILMMCVLVGCATQPPKLQFAKGPGPYALTCEVAPRYYLDFHIHAPSQKLRVTGLMQVVAVAERPDPNWHSGVNVNLVGPTEQSFVGLTGSVDTDLRGKISFALRWGTSPSQHTSFFETLATDRPIPFELTLDESYQVTASVAGTVKSVFVPPFKVVRASLDCSGAHVRYSNVIVSAN